MQAGRERDIQNLGSLSLEAFQEQDHSCWVVGVLPWVILPLVTAVVDHRITSDENERNENENETKSSFDVTWLTRF